MFGFGQKKKKPAPITDSDLQDFQQRLNEETEAYKKKVDENHGKVMAEGKARINQIREGGDKAVAEIKDQHASKMAGQFAEKASELQEKLDSGEISEADFDRKMKFHKRLYRQNG